MSLLSVGLLCCRQGPLGHDGDQVRPVGGSAVQVAVETARLDRNTGQRISLEESVAALTSMDSFQSLGATVVTRF